ncbi:MAG: site-2 protease family protein, partial [Acidimicrobiia bacterium]
LYAMGGLTAWSLERGRVAPGARAVVAAAGSGVGILLGLALLWAGRSGLLRPADPLLVFALDALVVVNLVWGVINWVPIRQLDGGHIVESLLQMAVPRRAAGIANGVFLVVALASTVAALLLRFYIAAVFAAWVAAGEVRRLMGRGQTAAEPERPAGEEA